MGIIKEDCKTNHKMISIIVPIYNAEIYLTEMIESVLAQTYSDWELLLINAGSEDGSLAICQKYAEEYENIYVMESEKQAPGISRNLGMKQARGKYICFVDADDYLSCPQLLEHYIQVGEKGKNDIVVCDYERLWNEKLLAAASHTSFSKYGIGNKEFCFRGFFSVGNLSYVWNKLYLKSFLETNDIWFSDHDYAEDKLFNMKCYLLGATYAFLSEKGYVYRKNEQSISHQYEKDRSKCWLDVARQIDSVRHTLMTDYTIFFASFFDAKMEYIQRKKSVWAVRRILKCYRRDELAKRSFKNLLKEKRKNLPDQLLWRWMMRGFSFFMNAKCYMLLAFGIKFLIDARIDERLSDTGLRD